MGRFENKVAIVTGAGSGIGRATAKQLVHEGALVVLAGRTEAKLRDTQEGMAPERCLVQCSDLAEETAAVKLVKATVERFARVDILVNNAGIAGVGCFLKKTALDWDEVVKNNLSSVYHMTRAAMPHLLKTAGAIVNVSSITGMGGEDGNSLYGATKAAVNNLTQSLALEFGESGVRVNCVCPGLTRTQMTEPLFIPDSPYSALLAEAIQRIPSRRAGTPEEVASAILFLASNEASFINGVNLPVDGGTSASNGFIRWNI